MIWAQLAEILGPIVIITLIGYALGRMTLGLQAHSLSTVVILVATPALVFHSLTSLEVDPGTIGQMAGTALICLVLAGLIAWGLVALFGGPVRSAVPAMMLPNSGNMGLPLVVLAFGDEGTRLGISYFFAVAVFQHTVGLTIASGKVSLGYLLRQPLVYSVLLVLVVTWFDLTVPPVIDRTTEMLGNMMIPAMLVLLGSSLASLRVSDIRTALVLAVGRQAIGVVTALVVIAVLGLQGVAAGVVFLMAVMPTAVVTYIFAERYDQNPRLMAGTVVVSTLLTFLTLPLLVWVALWFAGLGGIAE